MCITKCIHIRMCSGCTCHMQMACDILPHAEVQMANTGVTCPPYVICYTNVDIPIARSGNALAYDFNLLRLQRTFFVQLSKTLVLQPTLT